MEFVHFSSITHLMGLVVKKVLFLSQTHLCNNVIRDVDGVNNNLLLIGAFSCNVVKLITWCGITIVA